jgi:hypothetical protein
VLGLIILYALYLNLTPNPVTPTAHKTLVINTKSKSAGTDVADDDTVHFQPYLGTDHDPFTPGVSQDNATPGGPGSLIKGAKWVLTGINSINGVKNALVEDTATNQSEFLQPGDTWGNLRVVSISDDAINFVNNLGQVSQMGFPAPATPAGINNSTIGTSTPSLNQINPLPALSPGNTDQSTTGFRRFGRQPSN